jgi:hypothetical protein
VRHSARDIVSMYVSDGQAQPATPEKILLRAFNDSAQDLRLNGVEWQSLLPTTPAEAGRSKPATELRPAAIGPTTMLNPVGPLRDLAMSALVGAMASTPEPRGALRVFLRQSPRPE